MANENWCAVCGWSLAIGDDVIGCERGNCSRRPLPQYFTDPDRAIAEGYSRELVERHRRPPPPPCPSCARLASALARAEGERDEARKAANDHALCEHTQLTLLNQRDAALARADEADGLLKRAREAIDPPGSRLADEIDAYLGSREAKR